MAAAPERSFRLAGSVHRPDVQAEDIPVDEYPEGFGANGEADVETAMAVMERIGAHARTGGRKFTRDEMNER